MHNNKVAYRVSVQQHVPQSPLEVDAFSCNLLTEVFEEWLAILKRGEGALRQDLNLCGGTRSRSVHSLARNIKVATSD